MAEIERMSAASIPEASAEEVLRLGEDCLAGTIQLALAADQRGTTMTGILGAAGVALLAAAAAITKASPLPSAFLATAIVFFGATLLVAWSARPTDFYVGGYEPRLLAKANGSPVWVKQCAGADIQNRIDKNRAALVHASRFFNAGLVIAATAPIVGFVVYRLCS